MSGFTRAKLEIDETAATIAAEARYIPRALDAMLKAREDVQRQISTDPFFLTTFEPYDCNSSECSATVRRMCDASRAVGVGPMATVAGTIAQAGLEAMTAAGCEHGWIDNGGDVALLIERPATIEIFSDPRAHNAFALRIDPVGEVLGVCASSGRLGHSISLGESDVAVAMADSAVLADAVATALGNNVRRDTDLDRCFDPFKRVKGFRGGLVMLDGDVGIWGDIPRIMEVRHDPRRITIHSRSCGYADAIDRTCGPDWEVTN